LYFLFARKIPSKKEVHEITLAKHHHLAKQIVHPKNVSSTAPQLMPMLATSCQ